MIELFKFIIAHLIWVAYKPEQIDLIRRRLIFFTPPKDNNHVIACRPGVVPIGAQIHPY